ncbi:MAG: HAD-IIIA family hydrolase [Deltaproteobacteria bacterium]|nr:HAD-IIIA family hydrolase [Deltaproteobacteria bacterium]
MLILDVDGVLTDGRIVIDDRGVESKCFDEKDGHGLKLLMRAGVEVVLLSGRESAATRRRAEELGISEVYQNVHEKVGEYRRILEAAGVEDQEVGYVGDDLVDLPLLKRVGFSVVVGDSVEEIKPFADYVTQKDGGRGAVREVVEIILKSQGKWEEVTARYRG